MNRHVDVCEAESCCVCASKGAAKLERSRERARGRISQLQQGTWHTPEERGGQTVLSEVVG